MTQREREGGNRPKGCYSLENTDWTEAVRVDAVVYGPVGGAHCLLKWCFTHTHTHTNIHAIELVGDGRIPEDEGEEKQHTNPLMCSRMLQLTGNEAVPHVRTRRAVLQRPPGRICTSFQPTVTSHPTLN